MNKNKNKKKTKLPWVEYNQAMEKHRCRNQSQRQRPRQRGITLSNNIYAKRSRYSIHRQKIACQYHTRGCLITILCKTASGSCYFRCLAELNVSAKQVQARKARSTDLWPFAKTLILRANSILVCFVDKGLPTPKVEENVHHKQQVLWCELGKEREPSKGSVLFKKLK